MKKLAWMALATILASVAIAGLGQACSAALEPVTLGATERLLDAEIQQGEDEVVVELRQGRVTSVTGDKAQLPDDFTPWVPPGAGALLSVTDIEGEDGPMRTVSWRSNASTEALLTHYEQRLGAGARQDLRLPLGLLEVLTVQQPAREGEPRVLVSLTNVLGERTVSVVLRDAPPAEP